VKFANLSADTLSSKTLGQVPDQFIPIAEDSDLILEIGEWVIATARAQFAEWNSRFAIGHCVMSINISAAQLKDSSRWQN
jgi:EAL domain-containing protein (putative c-di-GMP-specific phosphodiesterase class I)